MTNEPAVPNLTELVMQAGAGSPRGMHFYSDAAKCGKRALLSDETHVDETVPMTPRDGKTGLRVGTFYHRLHELWRLNVLPPLNASPSMASEYTALYNVGDPSLTEALRLFHGYRCHWDRDLWGKPVGVELLLPTPEYKQSVMDTFGVQVTGKLDMVAVFEPEDEVGATVDGQPSPLTLANQRCKDITEPGAYVIDWKTSENAPDPLLYTLDTQALWYPALWQICHPALSLRYPMRGMIFDVIIKLSRRKDQSITPSSFDAVFAKAQPVERAIDELRGLIEQGVRNMQAATRQDRGNRAECVQYSYNRAKVCPHYGVKCLGA